MMCRIPPLSAFFLRLQDHEMLKLVNKKQKFNKFGLISKEIFEEVITQLEREAIKNVRRGF